ncbi:MULTISPECIES: ABC transporter permease [Brachybacterium]|uniref:ABC transporter permease n=1 Tax=Brachybacterium TaxID=43668 RepID=UPI000DF204A2|nr:MULTISPECIES: ABC transporter permease [Brachybacterium]RCS64578.1 ABC transporter permease [Brachybacterium sp. JB7]RCS76402.1 ABC transporter permease [Brachybacterium alimentarium]RCS79115.1 ABC transporter permease [Brachybacterium alimentarium]
MTASAVGGTKQTRGTASLRHRLADRGIDSQLLLMVPAIVFILALFVYPFAYGFGLTLQPTEDTVDTWGGGILANYVRFFGDAFTVESVWLTARLAIPAALFNVLVSIPLAIKLKPKFRGKQLISTLLVLPITLGTVLTAQGLLIFAGRQGWLNHTLMNLGILDQPLTLVHNYIGVLLSLIISGFPFAFLLISSYLSGIDPSLDRAARALGAGWAQRFLRITLPLLAPGLATTFILTFVLAFSVFPSATLVGDPSGSTRVLAVVAYRFFGEQFDYPMASTVAIMMGLAELAVVATVLLGRSFLYKGSTGGKG